MLLLLFLMLMWFFLKQQFDGGTILTFIFDYDTLYNRSCLPTIIPLLSPSLKMLQQKEIEFWCLDMFNTFIDLPTSHTDQPKLRTKKICSLFPVKTSSSFLVLKVHIGVCELIVGIKSNNLYVLRVYIHFKTM